MELSDVKNKLVAVLGYGIEGKAVTSYLLKHGLKPVLFDQRPLHEWTKEEQEMIIGSGLNFIFGPDCFKELAGFDLAFRSPGVRLLNVNLEPWMQHGLVITSQTKYFFEHCPAKIIGVTGTKGKGTTTSLIYEMLKKQFPNAYLTGNIGKVQPLEILDSLTQNDVIAYELSSFQLQDLKQSPNIGVVLMVTSEHMDYHKNELEYIKAKSSIVEFQKSSDIAIINADYPSSKEIGQLGKGQKVFFSRKSAANCYVKDGFILCEGVDPIPVDKLQLKGKHNWENFCAAILAAKLAGVSPETIVQVAKDFKGLEHRLQYLGTKEGIKFYDDSFSTTPETAIAAIEAFNEPEILILGGSPKNSDFTELAKTVVTTKNVKAIIFVGDEGQKIQSAIEIQKSFSGKIFTGAKNMKEIFSQIKLVATSGDVVLLSPACASFGMFKNYQDRGDQFKQCFNQW